MHPSCVLDATFVSELPVRDGIIELRGMVSFTVIRVVGSGVQTRPFAPESASP